jgi:hypothetical protein
MLNITVIRKWFSSTICIALSVIAILVIICGILASYVKFILSPQYYCFFYEPDGAGRSHRFFFTFLNSLITGEKRFKLDALVDQDFDKIGEYGDFFELVTLKSFRTMEIKGKPAYISRGIHEVFPNIVLRAGYYCRLYLPGSLSQNSYQHPSANIVDIQEKYWLCVGWPKLYGYLPRCAFLVNQEGKIYYCKNNVYQFSGLEKPLLLEKIIPNWTGENSRDFEIESILKFISEKEEWFVISVQRQKYFYSCIFNTSVNTQC